MKNRTKIALRNSNVPKDSKTLRLLSCRKGGQGKYEDRTIFVWRNEKSPQCCHPMLNQDHGMEI